MSQDQGALNGRLVNGNLVKELPDEGERLCGDVPQRGVEGGTAPSNGLSVTSLISLQRASRSEAETVD